MLHTAVGSLAGIDATFTNPANQVSSHVGIGLDGAVHEYVDHYDVAWANGRLEPDNRWPGPSPINPNWQSLSCETEDAGHPATEPVTGAQFRAVAAWGRSMLDLYPSIVYLVAHTAISPQTRTCPAARWLATGRFDSLAQILGLTPIR